MPNVTATPRTMQDGQRITRFIDSVGPAYVTWTYPKEQESFRITNQGLQPIVYSVGSYTDITVQPGQSSEQTVNFTTIQVKSTSGIQAFEVRTDESGNTFDQPGIKRVSEQVGSLLAFLFPNKINLFKAVDQTPGNIIDESYIRNSDFTVQPMAGYMVSSLIPVKSSHPYYFNKTDPTQSQFGAWYDSSGTVISTTITQIAVSPSNASYVRLNINKSVGLENVYFWEATEYKPKDRSNLKVNVIGDSITAGLGTSDAQHIWHYIVGQQLGFGTVRNYGLGNSTLAHATDQPVLSIVERADTMNPDADMIIVFGGVNDFLKTPATAPIGTMSSRDTTTFYGALHTLITTLQTKYCNPQILFMTPLNTKWSFTVNPTTGLTLRQYTDIILEVCNYYGVQVIDMQKECPIQPFNDASLKKFYTDGVHISDAGSYEVARTVTRRFLSGSTSQKNFSYGTTSNLANHGTDYVNWAIAGAGTTKGTNGIHLVQDGTTEYASLDLGLQPNALYTLVYNVTSVNINSTLLLAASTSAATCAIASSITIPVNLGVNKITFTTKSDLTGANRLGFVLSSGNTNGTYVDFKDMMILIGDQTANPAINQYKGYLV